MASRPMLAMQLRVILMNDKLNRSIAGMDRIPEYGVSIEIPPDTFRDYFWRFVDHLELAGLCLLGAIGYALMALPLVLMFMIR